ncbi:unnamed protein product, partial [Mesorhabditis spiculigera]
MTEVELADRLSQTVLAHVQSFLYNSAGAMHLLCDLNEYKKFVSGWRCGRDAVLPFERLHSLANLLVVLPDSLADAARSPTLANIDRTLIVNFIQLREDHKKVKAQNLVI